MTYPPLVPLEEAIPRQETRWETATKAAFGEPHLEVSGPKEALGFWATFMRERAAIKLDNVVAMTGPEGWGKSELTYALARLVEPDFHLTLADHWRLCYSARDLVAAYETVRPGQVVWFDEGVRGLFNRNAMTKEGKAVVQMLTLIRAKRATLFICVPDIFQFDVAVRGRRATLWFHITDMRKFARVHERDYTIRYLPDPHLHLEVSERAPYVSWSPLLEGTPEGAVYEKWKAEKMAEFLAETKTLAGHSEE